MADVADRAGVAPRTVSQVVGRESIVTLCHYRTSESVAVSVSSNRSNRDR
jgi:DNA-binding LacI/PurR family transcriptional regulator